MTAVYTFHARSYEWNPTYNIRIPAYTPAHVLPTGNTRYRSQKMQFQAKFSRIQAIGLLYPLPFTLSFESHCSSFLTVYHKFNSLRFLLTSGSITTMTAPEPSERERSASHACVVRVQRRNEGHQLSITLRSCE